MIIYDCEIKKTIQPKDEPRDPSLKYCQGWDDFSGMGISVICAHITSHDSWHVFMDDNLNIFQELVHQHLLAGWNNHRFDDKLVRANGIKIPENRSWDLKSALMLSAGLDPSRGQDHSGISLGSTYEANCGGSGKTGHGSSAPGLYQTGQIGTLTDYCLNDVLMVQRLINRVKAVGALRIKPGGKFYQISIPEAAI